MNKFCRQYISEVKSLFPLKGKAEKEYINKLISDVSAYCEEADVSSKEDLYSSYGTPEDVVHNYLSLSDTAYIAKRIRVSTQIRRMAVALIVLAAITTSACCLYFYHLYQMDLRQEVVICEEIIVEY